MHSLYAGQLRPRKTAEETKGLSSRQEMSKAGLGLGFGDLLESSVQEGPCSCFGHSNRLSAPPLSLPMLPLCPFLASGKGADVFKEV